MLPDLFEFWVVRFGVAIDLAAVVVAVVLVLALPLCVLLPSLLVRAFAVNLLLWRGREVWKAQFCPGRRPHVGAERFFYWY